MDHEDKESEFKFSNQEQLLEHFNKFHSEVEIEINSKSACPVCQKVII